MIPVVPWLKNAVLQASKPQQSIISVLKRELGGHRAGRSADVLHASDITKSDFCARKWALFDLLEKGVESQFIPTALDVTFRMGNVAERLVMEEWAGDAAVGHWQCRLCGLQRTMIAKPAGFCTTGVRHRWGYRQFVIEAPEYGLSGAIDGIFDVGAPHLLIAEIKTLNPTDFDTIMTPQPEHRLRTNLYLKMLAESNSPYKDKFNLSEARVLYISRGYGKMNATWNEILPFREFVVKRQDSDLKEILQKAKAVKLSREGQGMPTGICATALDKIAKKCVVCKECFSGTYPAKFPVSSLSV